MNIELNEAETRTAKVREAISNLNELLLDADYDGEPIYVRVGYEWDEDTHRPIQLVKTMDAI